jgi:protein-L-isoaspartate(D-aspartate) O-methyltransferase
VPAALAAVVRAAHAPAHRVAEADRYRPIPIAGGQVTTQPSLVAAIVEALALRGDERLLEIGTGLGYQAAVLAPPTRSRRPPPTWPCSPTSPTSRRS